MMRKSSAPSHSRNSGNGISPNSNYVRSIESILALLNNDESETFGDSLSIGTAPKIVERPANLQKENKFYENKVAHEQSISNNALILSQSKNVLYFKVVWGKPSTKKHKTWEGDGFLELSEKTATLRDKDGAVLGTKSLLLKPLVVDIGQIIS